MHGLRVKPAMTVSCHAGLDPASMALAAYAEDSGRVVIHWHALLSPGIHRLASGECTWQGQAAPNREPSRGPESLQQTIP